MEFQDLLKELGLAVNGQSSAQHVSEDPEFRQQTYCRMLKGFQLNLQTAACASGLQAWN